MKRLSCRVPHRAQRQSNNQMTVFISHYLQYWSYRCQRETLHCSMFDSSLWPDLSSLIQSSLSHNYHNAISFTLSTASLSFSLSGLRCTQRSSQQSHFTVSGQRLFRLYTRLCCTILSAAPCSFFNERFVTMEEYKDNL